jgi:ribosomal protein S8
MLNNKLKINKFFYHMISEIYKNNNRKKEFFFYRTKFNFNDILLKFVDFGYITCYIKYNDFYYIKLNTNNNAFINVKNAFKIKNKNKTILLKELINFNKNHGNIHNYLVNTDKGLVVGHVAINKRIGGRLLLSIV